MVVFTSARSVSPEGAEPVEVPAFLTVISAGNRLL